MFSEEDFKKKKCLQEKWLTVARGCEWMVWRTGVRRVFPKERERIIVCMSTWALFTIFEKFIYVYNTTWSYPPLPPSPKLTHPFCNTPPYHFFYSSQSPLSPICGRVSDNSLGHGQASNCSSPPKKSDSHGNHQLTVAPQLEMDSWKSLLVLEFLTGLILCRFSEGNSCW